MKIKNTTIIFAALLILTLVLPLLAAPLSTAQPLAAKSEESEEVVLGKNEETHTTHTIEYKLQEEGVVILRTDILTVMVNTKSGLPHFKWWVTGYNDTIYIAKFVSLIEFIDKNEDGAFQYNETVTMEDVSSQQEPQQGQQETPEFWSPVFPFAQGGALWNFSGFYNLTTENNEIIGIGFDFQLNISSTTLDETDRIAYSDLYVLLKCKIYFKDVEIEVEPDTIYYNMSGLAELKVDVVIENWPWHTDESMLALRWDVTVEEPKQMHHCYCVRMRGEEVDFNKTMEEERPIGPKDPKEKLTKMEFISEITNETHAYFGATTAALKINKTTGAKEVVSVTCSYRTDGNNIRFYIAYPHFERLEHDPVIGVTEKGYEEAGKVFSGRHGETRYEYSNGRVVLETPIFTVQVTAMGEVVHFQFWNTSDPEIVYHVKFVSIVEFVDENGDGTYQFNETVGGSMLTFPSLTWEFSGFQNITNANGETIGVKFSFNSSEVRVPRQQNLEIDIVCYMFFEDTEVNGVLVNGLTDLKFTIVIRNWSWTREDSMLALRWDISWSNVTEEKDVKPCVAGRDISLSGGMTEEEPIEGKEGKKALEIRCGKQVGYFDYTATIIVDGSEGEATASYITCENCIKVFLCYPHFETEATHDPIVGLTTTEETTAEEETTGEGITLPETIAGIPTMYLVGGIFLVIVIAVVMAVKKRH